MTQDLCSFRQSQAKFKWKQHREEVVHCRVIQASPIIEMKEVDLESSSGSISMSFQQLGFPFPVSIERHPELLQTPVVTPCSNALSVNSVSAGRVNKRKQRSESTGTAY